MCNLKRIFIDFARRRRAHDDYFIFVSLEHNFKLLFLFARIPKTINPVRIGMVVFGSLDPHLFTLTESSGSLDEFKPPSLEAGHSYLICTLYLH
jgi:hypothetical protein